MTIKFYKVNDEYGCFSNFFRHGFKFVGKYWMTSEHYFQAQKFIGTEYEEQVRMSSTPMEAANMGRDRSKPLRKDW
ncbi:NADAR family protein, partial [Clostridium sp. CTA-19]